MSLVWSTKVVSDQPKIPPSLSQLEVRSEQTKNTESDFFLFKKSLKALMSNPNFLLVFVSYGMNVGVFYAISTLLNQIILEYYSVSFDSYVVYIISMPYETILPFLGSASNNWIFGLDSYFIGIAWLHYRWHSSR